ncbi:hypothetical protein RB195_013098 [Necator americanus]|uniref:Uncharacterized protein n=1 Tax=Necator americanus TaxID=51031 RepID=A0ABR1DTY5_NECAM
MHFISVVILLITCSAVYSYTECSVLTKWPQEVRDPLLREIYFKFTPRWWSSWKWFKGRIKAFFKWITPSWLSWTLWLSRFSYAPLSNVKDLDYDCNLELKLAGKSIKLVEFFLSFAGGKDLQLKYEK